MNSTFSSHCTSIVSQTTLDGVENEFEIIFVTLPLDDEDFDEDLNETINTVHTVYTFEQNYFFHPIHDVDDTQDVYDEQEDQQNPDDQYEEEYDIADNILASLHLEDDGLDE